jgi:hypothetical protein
MPSPPMAAIPEADRQDAEPSRPERPFAAPDAGADYFATEAHYLSLATRIVARVRHGPSFALVTGEPPLDPRTIAPALMNVAGGAYAVGVVACGPELNHEQLLRAVPHSGTPLFVFDDADKLSDGQIEGLCESLAGREGPKTAAVLLARPSFLIRLEQWRPRLFREGLASHFRLYELGHDEIETFVRRQLRPGKEPAAFTAEAMTAISDFSGGDPAMVNRLSRLIAEFTDSARSNAAKKPVEGATEVAAPQSDIVTGPSRGIVSPESFETAPSAAPLIDETSLRKPLSAGAARERLARPSLPERRRTGRLLLRILLCLMIAGLVSMPGNFVSALGHRVVQRIAVFLDPWIDPLREQVFALMPRNTPPAADREPRAEKSMPPATSANAETATIIPAENTASVSVPVQPPAPAATTPSMVASEPKPSASIQAVPAETERIPATPSPGPGPSAVDTATLVARGDALVGVRDIASARLFYERAAEMGDGPAALRMGATFDPAFLERAGIRGTKGDQQEALSWYERARDLGDTEADRLLKTFKPH